MDLDEAEPLLVVVGGCAAEVEGLDLAPAEGGRHGGREGAVLGGSEVASQRLLVGFLSVCLSVCPLNLSTSSYSPKRLVQT